MAELQTAASTGSPGRPIESHSAAITLGRNLATSFVNNN
jgi:hypothetical protein